MESAVKAEAVRRIRASGRWCVRVAASQFQKSGLPDTVVHLLRPRGRAMWVEFKEPNKEPTRLQDAVIGEIRRSGAASAVAHSAAEALSLIEREEAAAAEFDDELKLLVMEALVYTHGVRYAKCGCAVCRLAILACPELLEGWPRVD